MNTPTIQDYKDWTKDHTNFMTPSIISVRKIANYFIELSEGTDFNHKPMFGVSVVEWDGQRFKTGTTGKSKSFIGATAEKDAKEYFKGLEL